MKKRLLKAAVATALTVAFAVPAFANPFSDVPAKSWAYDAVNKLAQAGIVDGYNDGTFRGDKTMTRYEMAQIVAKAMAKGNLNADQQATVDQLSKEFATELNTLGVKVDGLQNQVNNMVKVSGDARVRYFENASANGNDVTDYRARITFDGKISDNLKFNARLSSGNQSIDGKSGSVSMNTANVTFNALGAANTVGRQDIKIGNGFLADAQMNGITTQAGALKLFAGNITTNAWVQADGFTSDIANAKGASAVDRAYGAEYKFNLDGAKFNAQYLKNVTTNDQIYGVNTAFKLADGVTANAEYFKNNDQDAAAKAYGVKFDKVGLSATYRDVDGRALTPFSTMVTDTTSQYDQFTKDGGFKGMEYQYDKALDKNTTFTVKYQDFKGKTSDTKIDTRTSAAINVKF